MIEFACPNGHKIRCSKDRSGREAKCPRCNVRFHVPTVEEGAILLTAAEAAARAEAEGSDGKLSEPASDNPKNQRAAKQRQIEFLCPQGHHLHGPASLQGRPGECPECGSRFRIPSVDEFDAAAATDDEIRLEDDQAHEAEVVEEAMPLVEIVGVEPMDAEILEASSAIALPPESVTKTPVSGHPVSELFARLWAAKANGSRVEVHLDSGGVLLPDGYLKMPAYPQHVVLVTKDPDDTFTTTIVPWEAVARVIIRGVEQLPGELVR